MAQRMANAERRTWAERVRDTRTRRGWTGDTLAQVIGCTRASVSSWELGRTSPLGARRFALIALEAEVEVLPAIIETHTLPTAIHETVPVPAPVTAFKIAKGRCPVCLEYKVASVAMTPGDAAEPVTPLCFLCTWLEAILR